MAGEPCQRHVLGGKAARREMIDRHRNLRRERRRGCRSPAQALLEAKVRMPGRWSLRSLPARTGVGRCRVIGDTEDRGQAIGRRGGGAHAGRKAAQNEAEGQDVSHDMGQQDTDHTSHGTGLRFPLQGTHAAAKEGPATRHAVCVAKPGGNRQSPTRIDAAGIWSRLANPDRDAKPRCGRIGSQQLRAQPAATPSDHALGRFPCQTGRPNRMPH